jgi:hypothetical protein
MSRAFTKSITMIQRYAEEMGLHVQRRGVGDAAYIIKSDSLLGTPIYIATGLREAWAFLSGYEVGAIHASA